MAASVFDSQLLAQLFPTGETGRLFSDSAVVRAMLLVEGALARVQGQLGVIPDVSAAAIYRASLEVQIDPGALAQATGRNGVAVPALIAAFRAEMNAPEHAQFIHWGATSQDILDTGLMLRLRQALTLAEADIRSLLAAMADAADSHAETVMAARTYGQLATPTTWGAVLAQWGAPLLDALAALPALRAGSLLVSLSGAAGTSSALGPQAAETRAALAEALGLGDPGRSWHTDRGPVLRITDWMAGVSGTLGGMGATLAALSASGIEEMRFDGAGASSTMPQKQNPVGAVSLVALGHQVAAQQSAIRAAAMHQHQRDGAAWFAEWMCLPQIVLATASAFQISCALMRGTVPDTAQMQAALTGGLGLMQAEALSFALAERMPRSAAQHEVKALCARAIAENIPLRKLAQTAFADLGDSVFEPSSQVGEAPAQARAFVERVRSL